MLLTLSGRRASQDEGELRAFIALLRKRGVRRYCEIGARHGDTFHEVMMALPPNSEGLAVDLPGGLWGRATSAPALRTAVRRLRGASRDCSLLFGDSREPAVIAQILSRGPWDAILIDGDHTYEGVSADYMAFGQAAPLVALHDIVGDGQAERGGRPVEVPRLWAEIVDSGARTVEFVSPGSRMGIGVVLCA